MTENKIKSHGALVLAALEETRKGRKVGFTNGCFDILHKGHVEYLEKARTLCDVLIVGVNSDTSVKGLKGNARPLNAENARCRVIAGLECVDHVTVFSEDTPEMLIKKIRPTVLFKGGDWKESDVAGGEFVKSIGGKVVIIPFVEGFSTTAIINKMKSTEHL
ncbi:MAG: D-glycero-beta-D-manno-heptose 1-phosphate adenylyltransferase [Candidatus Omnitrophica bacterium]|nr:D-glycero-beta-D-manno-heptose 1-phosphate adenylyltransferase [Candidatus Omnitrophota bacterium]